MKYHKTRLGKLKTEFNIINDELGYALAVADILSNGEFYTQLGIEPGDRDKHTQAAIRAYNLLREAKQGIEAHLKSFAA